MEKEDNVLQRFLVQLFKQDNWTELNYKFYMWKPRRKLRDVYIWCHDQIYPNNVIKIDQLPKSWCDRDSIVFHAPFQALVDFVEKEKPFQPSWDENDKPVPLYTPQEMRDFMENWLGVEAAKQRYAEYIKNGWQLEHVVGEIRGMFSQRDRSLELIFLYDWYKFRLPHRKEYVLNIRRSKQEMDIISPSLRELFDRDDDENEKFITSEEYWELEQEQDLIDDIMLYRLIKLRRSMWT